MNLIAICGGGGKTTIARRWPDLFMDIDQFIWSKENIHYPKLVEIFRDKSYKDIKNVYKDSFILAPIDNRTILTHHPLNADIFGAECIDIIRPIKAIHLKNIANRSEILKKLSIESWENLTPYNPYEYSSYAKFETRLLRGKNE